MILPRGGEKCDIEYTVTAEQDENVYRIDVYLPHAERYSALQFSFNWDQTSFSLLDWAPGEGIAADDIRMPDAKGKNASLAAFTADEWSRGKMPLLSFWVENQASIKYPFQLHVNPSPTQPVAYAVDNGQELQVQLKQNNTGDNLMDNRPNPFTDLTTIHFVSHRSEPATLKVIDLDGQVVFTREIELVPGDNEFVVRKSEVRASGIFMYEIESDLQYSTNRMIIVD
jgi:hypothetical protein